MMFYTYKTKLFLYQRRLILLIYVTQKYNCYHRQSNAKHFEKLDLRKFTSFYQQKGDKTEPPGYNLTKFGQKV